MGSAFSNELLSRLSQRQQFLNIYVPIPLFTNLGLVCLFTYHFTTIHLIKTGIAKKPKNPT